MVSVRKDLNTVFPVNQDMAKPFIHFWEAISDKEGANERARSVLEPVLKYNRNAKKVLELGVGIGQVLRHFPKSFELWGLDYNKSYVSYCKKKINRGTFFQSSMHNFRIAQSFDVIFSVYDSINFLDTFEQWKSTFRTVHAHLNDKGLFVFDMYTPKILSDFKGKEASAEKFSMGYIYDRPLIKGNTLTWDFKVFEKAGKKYELNEYLWKETIWPVQKVKNELKHHFDILETKLSEEGRRILFVCRKKKD
jgi:cyclopropane fatty-acyl-phospholipid synthase-like methyltransferase